jgi:hypothetical protein
MNFRKLLYMLLALGAVFGAIYIAEYDANQKPNLRGKALLSALTPKDISEIEVNADAGRMVVLKDAETNKWVMERPLGFPANEERVAKILDTLFSLVVTNELEIKPDLNNKFGVRPPLSIVRLKFPEGHIQLNFGFLNTATKSHYVTFEGEEKRLFIVPQISFAEMSNEKVRKRKLLDLNNLSALAVFSQNTSRVFEHAMDDIWFVLEKDKRVRADNLLVQEAIKQLQDLEVKRFIDLPGKDLRIYGLNAPKFGVRIMRGSDSPVEVLFGEGEDAKRYFTIVGKPWVYEYEGQILRNALLPFEELISKEPFSSLEYDDIRVLDFRTKKEGVAIDVSKAMRAALNEPRLQTWHRALQGVRVLSYVPLSDLKGLTYVCDINIQTEHRAGTYTLSFSEQSLDATTPSAPIYALVRGEDTEIRGAIVPVSYVKELCVSEDYFLRSHIDS